MRLINHQLADILVPLTLLLHFVFFNILTSFYKRHLYTKHWFIYDSQCCLFFIF